MKKILIISADLSVKGGVSSMISSLLDEFSEHKNIRVDFYSTYIDSIPPLARVFHSLLRVIIFFMSFKFVKYDVFYIHVCAFGSFYRKTIYVMLLSALGKKVVIHQHAADLEIFLKKNKLNHWIGRAVYSLSSKIIVLSENMKEITETNTRNNKSYIVENPVAIPSFNKPAAVEPSKKLQLLFLGEIGARKGIYDLIKAISELEDNYKKKILLHIGGNKEIDRLTAMIKENKLDDSCVVHGWVSGHHKIQLLQESDIFILPSYFEGVPISILEAMAYQLPIISTNIAGIPEIVFNNHNGFLVSAGDIEEIKYSIIRFIEEPQLIYEFGLNSRSIIEKHDVSKVAAKILGILDVGESGKTEKVAIH